MLSAGGVGGGVGGGGGVVECVNFLLVSDSKAVESMLDEMKLFYFFNQRLIQARDLLLPRLMSGKVAVW